MASRTSFYLPDSSKVWLNAGSRLIYPETFAGKTREISLFGEAFFKVTRDESKPFIVKTTDLDIKVLGTQFNVSAYPDDYSIQTTLQEGSVAISKQDAGFFDRDIILQPDQMGVFDKQSKKSKVYPVDAKNSSIWTEGLLKFKDDDLSRIVRKIERYYNVFISLESPALAQTKMTGKLDLSQDLDEVLEYLSKVSQCTYEKVNNNNYLLKK